MVPSRTELCFTQAYIRHSLSSPSMPGPDLCRCASCTETSNKPCVLNEFSFKHAFMCYHFCPYLNSNNAYDGPLLQTRRTGALICSDYSCLSSIWNFRPNTPSCNHVQPPSSIVPSKHRIANHSVGKNAHISCACE